MDETTKPRRVFSEEHRAKLRAAKLGKKQPAAVRQKRSESHIRRAALVKAALAAYEVRQ